MTSATDPPGEPSPPSSPPARVRVTSTRRDAPTRRDLRPLTRDIDEQSTLGEVYMSGLMSAQLRLALRVLAFGAVGLGGLPLLFLLVPATRTMEVGRFPLPWIVLAVVVYPVALIVARFYVRASERIEAEFSSVVRRR
ncbi:hypothetical protein SAMN04489867_3416 [Pedococcus dokdonensis]|uniref:Uncharacterized protein n=1 Tax=Pedococcus dokdonensis TaxID=443156 RepID=A0A1H0UN23_9MICO|nr:hypothetical protein [Pedococcus dokdonensis]SDP67579.1 hypothetical protein SAMN04489867_3416 [Pedococcus dokdonensis]